MNGIACLLKDTQILEDAKELIRALAADAILDGRKFTLRDAYNQIRSSDIEMDLATVGYLYEESLDLSDANFDTYRQVQKQVGREYDRILDSMINVNPFTGEKQIDEISPGKYAANSIAKIFAQALKVDNGTNSVTRMFQDRMTKAARNLVNRNVLPNNRVQDNRDYIEILEDAFDLNNQGIPTVSGYLNSAIDVFEEFKNEVGRYLSDMEAKGATAHEVALLQEYAGHIINKGYDLLLSGREANTVVKQALIKAGFYRENNKGERVLDWKLLTDGVNSTLFFADNVEKALGADFTQAQKAIITSALEREYVRLRQGIIEKSQKELERRNRVLLPSSNSTDTKKLAQLYAFGFFEELPNTYANLVNKAFGMDEVDQDLFNRLSNLGKSLHTLFSTGGRDRTDDQIKSAINEINEKIGNLLIEHQNNKDKLLKTARIIQSYMQLSVRMLLNTFKNGLLQNQISGLEIVFRTNLLGRFGFGTAAGRSQGRDVAMATLKDMALAGGISYGDISSLYSNKGGFDRAINKMSDSKIWHALVGTIMGRTTLDAADSYYKVQITHNYFVQNLAKILMNPAIGMTKDQAISEISKSLYGRSFEDAKILSRSIIDRINTESVDGKVLRNDDVNITRLASDLVKGNLVSMTPLTEDMVTAAYDAAYRIAGREMGHVPNNIVTLGIQGINTTFSDKAKAAARDSNFLEAAMWTMAQTFSGTFMNTFVGGGTNWLINLTEQMGLGLVTGTLNIIKNRNDEKVSDIDILTNEGIVKLEEALYEESKITMKLGKGAIGAAISLIMFGLMVSIFKGMASGDDDEYETFVAWRKNKNNKWISRYVDETRIEFMLLYAGFKTGDPGLYFTKAFRTEQDRYTFRAKVTKAMKLYKDGDYAEAEGILGEAVGSFFRVPVPHLAFKEASDILDGLNGEYKPQEYTKAKGFIEGFFSRGLIEKTGIIPRGLNDLGSIPGMGPAKMGKLRELGYDDIYKIKELINQNPDNPVEVLKAIKIEEDGKKKSIFTESDAQRVIEIIRNGMRDPKVKFDDLPIKDEEGKLSSMGEVLKRNKINTMYELVRRWGDVKNFTSADSQTWTPEQIEQIESMIKQYEEDIQKVED